MHVHIMFLFNGFAIRQRIYSYTLLMMCLQTDYVTATCLINST